MEKTLIRVCTIEAPCKINLHLAIGEKRPDGFHDLQSIFASLALADTLRFECAGRDGDCGLSVDWNVPGDLIPPEKNLVYRAVSLFRERTGFRKGLKIRLIKRIPVGAGLGGGSSDAASSLLALKILAEGVDGVPKSALTTKKLGEMAALLGSDVPFFLTGRAAIVSGRGECVESVKFPGKLWVVLSKPPFSSDTESAFRLLDQARKRETVKKTEKNIPAETFSGKNFPVKELSKEALRRALEDDPGAWPFHNDFLPVFLNNNGKNAAAYLSILESFRKTGSCFSGLSGSGSCCFGIFKSKEAAEKAEKALSGGEPRSCRTSAAGSGGEPRSMDPAAGSGGEPRPMGPAAGSGSENYVGLTFFLAQKANPVLEY